METGSRDVKTLTWLIMEEVGAYGEVWNGWKGARDTLRRWREENSRKSDLVLELGRPLLQSYVSSLGNEVWDVHEQVCIAALDCGNQDTAERSLEALKRQFPDSLRVIKLEGMCREACGDYEEALKLYSKALDKYPNTAVLWKRKVAVHKARGDIEEAVKELCQFLEVFMSDTEGWMELADLYIDQNDLKKNWEKAWDHYYVMDQKWWTRYDKAAYCLEELVLANPHHHLYHQRYAEVCYTQGTVDGLEVARKHFATALKLNPDNLRALYGFCSASHALTTHSKVKSKGEVKTKNARYIDWAKSQLKQKYQFDNEKLRIVERVLDSMGTSR